jgi:hypothetical protein
MALLLPKSSSISSAVSISLRHSNSELSVNCWIDLSSNSHSRSAFCRNSVFYMAIPTAFSFSVQLLAVPDSTLAYDLVQVTFTDNTQKLVFSSLPHVSGVETSYLLSFNGLVLDVGGDTVQEERDATVQLSTLENISIEGEQPSAPADFYNGNRITGLAIGAIVLVAIIAALVITMVINGKKTTPTKPPAGTIPASGSTNFAPNSDGSLAIGSTATMSTTASNTPTSVSHYLGSVPIAGGVISASMSSTLKGAYSMSPASDTPLQGEMIGQHTSNVVVGRPGTSSNRTANGANQQQQPSNHIPGTMRQKKKEKVALADSLLYSPRPKAPPKVSNAVLAALPTEPAPKLKQKYLVAHQVTTKSLPAKKNVRYHDLVDPPSKTGTLRGGNNGGDPVSKFKSKRPKKKNLSSSSLGDEHMGNLDSFIGDDDGTSGLFTDDDDGEWIDDVVEPHPDDPIYKNDDFYVEIDVDKLDFVPPPKLDTSIDVLDSHIAALVSPLTASKSSLSRSSSSVAAAATTNQVSGDLADSTSTSTSSVNNVSSSIVASSSAASMAPPGTRKAMKLSKSTESVPKSEIIRSESGLSSSGGVAASSESGPSNPLSGSISPSSSQHQLNPSTSATSVGSSTSSSSTQTGKWTLGARPAKPHH